MQLTTHHTKPHTFPTRRSSDLEYDHKQARECTHTLSQATNRVRDNEHEQSLEVDKSKNNQTSNNKYVKPSKKQNLCHKRDRKSTRLNSSHVAISYAVFCLNKKT